MKIDQKCWVTFSIGPTYQDFVWCDVVVMDVGHLLLGRPWQYDQGAIHDGWKNTYSFRCGTKEIVLLPSQEGDALQPMPMASLEPSSGQIHRVTWLEPQSWLFLLIAKDPNSQETRAPKVEALLERCHDIIPNEIPSGLPPL